VEERELAGETEALEENSTWDGTQVAVLEAKD
jgi:hypothetical protein